MMATQAGTGSARSWIYLVLVLGFCVQTWLVYFDGVHAVSAFPLREPARRGLGLWRANNCQACHQIHGFGGFLGPDLTNLVARRPYEDWTDILTEGRKQMPAFDFDEQQRADIVAFLTEINDTGTGYPRLATLKGGVDPNRLVAEYAGGTGRAVDEGVLYGERLIGVNGCNSCHIPFAVGNKGAPDLTALMSWTSPGEVRRSILESKGSMPAYPFLSAEEVDAMILSMDWMNDNRRQLGLYHSNTGRNLKWTAIPWWEYPNN